MSLSGPVCFGLSMIDVQFTHECTGIVTAPLVAFYWLDPQCSVVPTLFLDTVIDIFFLVDILVNFKTGIFEAGEYIDDPAVVTKAYLKGSFTFDCFTSFPVSFFEQAAKAVCDSGNDPADTGALRVVRALKPLRFIKIIRIMKVGKAGPLIAHLMDYWNISPKQGKTWRLMVVLVMSIHMVACAWWLWKVMGMKLDEVNDFLDAQSWGQYERSNLMTDEGKIEAYIIAVYVTTMTLTTVGYGDISADNTSERVGYIVLFIAGAFIWGELMAGLGEIHQALS